MTAPPPMPVKPRLWDRTPVCGCRFDQARVARPCELHRDGVAGMLVTA